MRMKSGKINKKTTVERVRERIHRDQDRQRVQAKTEGGRENNFIFFLGVTLLANSIS